MTELSFERSVLENGLTVLFHRNDRVPLLSLCAFFLAGKDQNPLDSPGLASLTADCWMKGHSDSPRSRSPGSWKEWARSCRPSASASCRGPT